MTIAVWSLSVILGLVLIIWITRERRDVYCVDGSTHTPESEIEVMRRYNLIAVESLSRGQLLVLGTTNVSGVGTGYSFYVQCTKCRKNLHPYMGSMGG